MIARLPTISTASPSTSVANACQAARSPNSVCSAAASNADAAIELREAEDWSGGSTVTRVRGELLRLAIMAPLLDAVAGIERNTRASAVLCTLGGDATHVIVTIGAVGRRASMPDAVADVVRAGGVGWTGHSQDLSLAFPRA